MVGNIPAVPKIPWSHVQKAAKILQATLRFEELKNVGDMVQHGWIAEVDWLILGNGRVIVYLHSLFVRRFIVAIVRFLV
jgi:hypothetical protein